MACVLIVEDDPDVCLMMEFLLDANGYETMKAHNGLEALQQMRARTPCVVLLDMHMPFIDGWEFRRHQLRDPKCAAVPILAVTAHYDPHEVERKLCVRCLQKPISIDYVITEVERACDAQRQGGAMEHGPFARLGVR